MSRHGFAFPEPAAPQRGTRASWIGWPHFTWTLTLLGFCIFTFTIVTTRFPMAQMGIAVAAVGLVLQKDRIRMPLPIWLYGAFLLWAFVASLASQYQDVANEQILERLKLLVVMFIAVNALQTEGRLRFYLLFFLACFVVYPVRGTLYNYLVVDYTRFGRAIWQSTYENSNHLAALCLLTLGIAIGLSRSLSSRTLARLSAGVSAILLLVVLLLTESRGAFVGLVAGMGPAVVFLIAKRPIRLVPAAAVGLAIALAVPATVWERLSGLEKLTAISTIAQADPEGSAEQRFEIQKVAWQIFADNPVFGVGLGAYPLVNEAYAPKLGRMDTHNTYLNLAAEVGLPGLVLWCVLFGSVLRYAYRSRRLAAAGDQATQQAWIERALWGYLVAGIFGSFAGLTFPYIILATLWCSATLLASGPPLLQPAARKETA